MKELIDFLEWYWKEIDGKPYSVSALTVVEDYLHRDNNICNYKYHNKDIEYLGCCEKCKGTKTI